MYTPRPPELLPLSRRPLPAATVVVRGHGVTLWEHRFPRQQQTNGLLCEHTHTSVALYSHVHTYDMVYIDNYELETRPGQAYGI